jgi:hypothetical protein
MKRASAKVLSAAANPTATNPRIKRGRRPGAGATTEGIVGDRAGLGGRAGALAGASVGAAASSIDGAKG